MLQDPFLHHISKPQTEIYFGGEGVLVPSVPLLIVSLPSVPCPLCPPPRSTPLIQL